MLAHRRTIAAIPLIAILVSGCMPRTTVNYRMTIEVDTPSGPARGSGVYSLAVSDPVAWARQFSGSAYDVTGEAIVLDPPGKAIYFATMRRGNGLGSNFGDYADPLARTAFPDGISREKWEALKRAGGSFELVDDLPWIVRFSDPLRPESVVIASGPRDLEAKPSQVREVVIRSVKMETTPDPPTTGQISRWLPWIANWRGSLMRADPRQPANGLLTEDFSQVDGL